MLFNGPGLPPNGNLLDGGAVLNSGSDVTWSGDGGVESPRTAVLGRKRLAITTLWFLSELIVHDDADAGTTKR